MTRDEIFNLLLRKYEDMSWEDLHASQFVLKTGNVYWRPKSCGYGPLWEAGLYSFNEAARIVGYEREARDQMIPIQKLKNELIDILQGASRLMVAIREYEETDCSQTS